MALLPYVRKWIKAQSTTTVTKQIVDSLPERELLNCAVELFPGYAPACKKAL